MWGWHSHVVGVRQRSPAPFVWDLQDWISSWRPPAPPPSLCCVNTLTAAWCTRWPQISLLNITKAPAWGFYECGSKQQGQSLALSHLLPTAGTDKRTYGWTLKEFLSSYQRAFHYKHKANIKKGSGPLQVFHFQTVLKGFFFLCLFHMSAQAATVATSEIQY